MLANLRLGPGLLVLDNFETPWEVTAERSTIERDLRWLGAIPELSLFASLRSGSEVPGGARWEPIFLQPLKDHDARRLLFDIAQQLQTDDPLVNEFLELMGGIPLAIELVARRIGQGKQLDVFLDEWNVVGTKLATRLNPREHRLDSLPISIEISFRSPRLTANSRLLFSLLGQLPAGINREDQRSLLGVIAGQAVDELIAVGLAYRNDTARVEMLPPIREHSRRCHAPQEDLSRAWIRHYLSLARDLGERIGKEGGEVANSRLIPESANIEAAFHAAATCNQLRQEAVQSIEGFTRLARLTRGGSPEPLRILAESCSSDGDVRSRAVALRSLADITYIRSNHAEAEAAYTTALKLYREIKDDGGQARCLKGLGDIAAEQVRYKKARYLLKRAFILSRKSEDFLGEANCICQLARIALEIGEYDQAIGGFTTALDVYRSAYRQTGETVGWANCVHRLAEIDRLRGDEESEKECEDKAQELYASAAERYDTARDLYTKAGSELGIANCIKGLGDVALQTSDAAAAENAFAKARISYAALGAIVNTANAIRELGDVAVIRNDTAKAMEYWHSCLHLYNQVNDQFNAGGIYIRLARNVDSPNERRVFLKAASDVWSSIDRTDLIKKYVDPLWSNYAMVINRMGGPY